MTDRLFFLKDRLFWGYFFRKDRYCHATQPHHVGLNWGPRLPPAQRVFCYVILAVFGRTMDAVTVMVEPVLIVQWQHSALLFPASFNCSQMLPLMLSVNAILIHRKASSRSFANDTSLPSIPNVTWNEPLEFEVSASYAPASQILTFLTDSQISSLTMSCQMEAPVQST